jgi:glutathione synthase/RimK-type ligase-like ATP-grasp enzyme
MRVTTSAADVHILYEHPEWQKPLFSALERRGVRFSTLDLKKAAFVAGDPPAARLVFNQASPSAYLRGNARAVPLALAYLKSIEDCGIAVVNGARAFSLELSKTTQAALLARLGLRTPRSIAFNDLDALRVQLETESWKWPALLKPEQGGSGARIQKLDSYDDLRAHVEKTRGIWEPDGLLLLQEYFEHDHDRGIVRMEFLGGELLYAMRVVSHGRYNLCPSEMCNPASGEEGHCAIPAAAAAKPVEFYAFKEVPPEAVEAGKKIMKAGGIDVGGIEYLESLAGERVFYDVNANSNLRAPIAREHGFDPFERVVDYLVRRLDELRERESGERLREGFENAPPRVVRANDQSEVVVNRNDLR